MAESILFDRYRLIAPAGTGGSASVWRAHDERTGDEVAVKRLHPVVVADEAARRRLRREFRALRRLRGPLIARVRDLHVADGDAAIVLDYVPGRSLAEHLSAGSPVPPDEAVAIASDVAAALSAAHEAGIVHRDVTPANILLGEDGRARLTDFGIALGTDDAARQTAVTGTGLLIGTPRYVAPERLRGEPATTASDLFALAAVVYEMLAGRPAFSTIAPLALAEEQLAGPPPIPGVPAALDAAVRWGLAPEPHDRPADVGAFATALERAVGQDHGWADTTVMPIVGAAASGPGTVARVAAEDGGGQVDQASVARRPVGGLAAAVASGALVLAGVLVATAGWDGSLFDPFDAGRRAVGPGHPLAAEPSPTSTPSSIPAALPTEVPAADTDDGGPEKGKGGGNAGGKGKGKPPKDR